MALVVEDGTGLADAESYLGVAAFDAHCAKWGYDLTGRTETQKEVALRKAAAFIDTLGRYKSARVSAAQALEFPRSGLTDWGGLVIEGVPARVIRACAELAYKALTETLQDDLDRGGRIQSESVGPISVSYAADAPAGKVYRLAQELLAPFLQDERGDLRGPAYEAPAADAAFFFGMHDHPGG